MRRLTKKNILRSISLMIWLFFLALPAEAQVELPTPPADPPPVQVVPSVPSAPEAPAIAPPATEPPSPTRTGDKGFCSHLGVFAGSCEALNGVGKAMQDPTIIPGAAAEAAFDRAAGLSVGAITDWVANGAAWLMGQLGDLIGRSTTPQLDAGWFKEHYRAMVALAGIIVLPLLLLSIIGALVAQDLGRLLRTVFGFLPLAGIFSATAVGFVILGLTITDGMTAWVTQGASADATAFLTRSADALHSMQSDNAALFAVFLGAVVMALGAVVVWIELLVRQAAVYVAVLFLPLSIAGIVWPATAHWFKRLAHILVAVILSKFVIAAILSLAASGLAANAAEGGGFSAVLSGGALLTLAAVSPMALMKLAPILEAGFVTSTANARSGQTAATSAAAVGGPTWLYGQARNWATRDSSTPGPKSWSTPKHGSTGGAAAAAGGPKQWVAGQAVKAAGAARPQGVALAQATGQQPARRSTNAASAPAATGAPTGRRRIGDNGSKPQAGRPQS